MTAAANEPVRVLHVGLGPLGRLIASDVHARGAGVVVAAVDPDPALAGRPLGDFAPGTTPGVTIDADLARAADSAAFDAAIVTTVSSLASCAPTFRTLLDRGATVVSTCEELVYPHLRHALLADELHALALRRGGRLLGTGVNPGFLMDLLPVVASGVCRVVRAVRVRRVQDASTRRVPFQRKIGAGLDRDAFERGVRKGWLRHVGLGESLHFIADRLRLEIEDWSESVEPVLAERELRCALGVIEPGQAAGVRQVAVGVGRGRDTVRLEFVAAIGQPDPHDSVRIDGEPPIDLTIRGGVHGDTATVAITVNAIRPLLASPPGLHTMSTIVPPACDRHATAPLQHGR